MKKYIYISILFIGYLITGCSITGEFPDAEYFLNKQWKIEKVAVSGQMDTQTDLSLYRIQLNKDYTFEETSIEGVENVGVWQLDNNGTVLTLEYESGEELQYLVVELQIRKLILRVLQSDNKIGSLDILYFMVPVKQ
jgi:hypothetical protein